MIDAFTATILIGVGHFKWADEDDAPAGQIDEARERGFVQRRRMLLTPLGSKTLEKYITHTEKMPRRRIRPITTWVDINDWHHPEDTETPHHEHRNDSDTHPLRLAG